MRCCTDPSAHAALFGDAANRIDNVAVTFDVESLA